jgi:CBS domain-containing protein
MRNVRDILNGKSREVHSIGPKATVLDALIMMGDKMIGSLMVIDEADKLVGILTERDYVRKIRLKGKRSAETLVEEIMTPRAELYTVKPETTVADCMVLITGKKVRHLPVFDGDNFVGLVSIGDVTKSIVSEQDTLIEHLSDYIAGKYV